MNYMSSCYLRRRKRKPLPTAKSYAKSLCGKVAESVAHALAGCSSLAQTKYLYRHNAALKILFFELLREHGLIEEVPPRYSPVMPKPAYQNTTSEASFGIFPSMHSTTKLEQIGSTRDLSAKRGKRTKHSSMGP